MSGVERAGQAVTEARAALVRRLYPWSVDPEQAEATADALITAVRELVACEIENHPGPIPYRPALDEDGGFWWDTRDRDAAARIAREGLTKEKP